MARGSAGRRPRVGQNVARKLIGSHLADGEMTAGSEIGLRIDQTLTQGDNISTDEILPAGARVLPFTSTRSSPPATSGCAW